MYTLGLDLGATYIKAGLFDQSKNCLLRSHREVFPPFLSELGLEREVDTQPILEVVFKLVQDLTHSVAGRVDLWISNQMQGFVLVDPSSAKAASNFISWQDQRSTLLWDQIDNIYTPSILSQIGNELWVGHAAATLYAINFKEPLVAGLMPVSLGDFVVGQLTGRMGPIHDTNASGFGCFNIEDSGWNENLIKSLGLDHLIWPEISKGFEPAWAKSNLRVFGAVGDFQASLLGAGLKEEKCLSLNVATGSQVSRLVSNLSHAYPGQLRPYFSGKTLNCHTHLPAGRALNFILKPFLAHEGRSLEEAFKALEGKTLNDSDLKISLNIFSTGKGAGGSISCIRENNLTSESILVAALTSMAETYRDCRASIDPAGECSRILASGGIITKSSYFQRLIEKKIGLPVSIATAQEDALWGLFQLSQGKTK